METGKQGFVNISALGSSVSAKKEASMHVQAPLTTMLVHTMPVLPPHPQAQTHPQAHLAAASQEPANLQLAVPPLYAKETLPFLTLHFPGGLQLHQGPSQGTTTSAARHKSAGKHLCSHCGRDCLKPSVLEKHLRCHTGERPYPCNTCGVSFKTQSNLYKHKRTQAHARLSSECEQSSVGSQDSLYSSGDAGTSGLSLDSISADSGNQEMEVSAPLPQASSSFNSVLPTASAVVGSETGWALHHAALVGLILAPESDYKIPLGHDAKSEGRNVHEKTKKEDKDERTESIKPSLTPNRHLPLQRQEATMFSKQWEGSMTSGKSQSHDSTDSGFSESSEQPWTSSPGSVLPDHSMESLTESSLEIHSQPSTTNISTEPGPTPSENKASVSEQEQKKLEERISKLISENDALVDDKHLENVRPRKTMLSKQGSIDLPMPYTYKDSFHFEIKTTKPSNAVLGWQKMGRGGRAALYNSLPTQCSTTLEHAPMKRSSSLPFSVGIQHSERSSNNSPHLRDFITLARRGSSGHIYPAGFGTKSMDQQVSNHRPLVRQAAMDCNPATEGLAMTTPLEEVCPNNLSSDGDSVDICGEPSSQKYRRKKTQKFAYNKWYMYGGGTFKKLYSTDKTEDNSVLKARKSVTGMEYEGVQGSQRRCSAVHKELVTSAGSTKESSTTVCHPSSLPAYLPTIASVNAHHSGGHLNSFCASLKTTLGEKLPLTTHQPTTEPANTQNELSYQSSKSAGDSVMHGGNHTDSVYPIQHCANYNPSETKKQKTDNSLCSSGRQVDPSASKTLTQPVSDGKSCPAPSVKKTNRTYVNTSSSSNNSTTAKTSFLPKYQLKIPNSSDPDSAPTVNQPTGVITQNTICTLSSYQSSWTNVTAMKDTSFSKQKCMDLVALPLSHKYSIASRSDSTQSQSASPVTTAIQYQPVVSFTRQSHIAIPTPAVVQRQPATNKALVESLSVITSTALLQDRDAKPPITFLQNTPVVASARNLSPTCTSLTTSDKPLIVAPCTVSTERQCLTPSTTSLSVNASLTEEVKTATMPCQIIQHKDIEQSAAQNVFHVRTADLQICLQIISDEQLALIEPQIDLQGSTRESEFSSYGGETWTNTISNSHEQQSHFPRAKDNTNTGIGREISECQEPMELNIKTLLPGCFPQSKQNITFTGHSNVRQTNKPSFMEFTPSTNTRQMSHCWQVSSTSPNPSVNPGTHTRMLPPKPKNKESVVPAALSSFKGVKTERKQTQEEEHAVSICVLSESCPQPRMLISQMGHVSEALSGHHKLCQATLTSFSSSASAKNSPLQKCVSQHKSLNERATCNVDEMITRHETLEAEDPTTGGMHGESDVPLQSCSGQRSNVESSVALPRKEPSSSDKQACELSCEPGLKEILVYGGFMESEPGNSEVISSHKMSSKRSAVEGIQIEAPDVQVPLLCQAQRKSEEITPANHRDTQPIQFTSVPCCIKEETPKHDVLFANQCLTKGVVSRSESSLQGQKEMLSPNRPPWQLHSPATEPRESHGAREPDNLATEPKESDGAGEPDNLATEPRDSHGAGEPDNLAKKHKESHGVGEPDNLAKKHKESHGVGEPDNLAKEHKESHGVGEPHDPATEHEESQDSREPENQHTKKQQMRGIIKKKDGGQISFKSDKVLEQGEVMQKGGVQCKPQTDVLGAEHHDVQDKADSHQNSAKSHQPLSQTDAGKCFNPIQLSQQRTITPSNMNSPGICNTSIPNTSQPENKSNGGQFHQHPSLCDTKWLQANQPSHMIKNQHGQSETCHTETTQQCYVKETSAIGCFSNSFSTSLMQQTPNPSSVCKAHVSAVLGEMIIYTHQSGSDAMKTPIQPSNTGTSAHTQPGDRHDKWDLTAPIYTALTNVPVGQDGSSKYFSLSSTGQSHHSPLPDCLLSGVRAVQSSLEDPEDTSSSDDEGKLIIEL